MPWYIHRIGLQFSRPILRPTLRFICTAMHHHEAEKLRFFFHPGMWWVKLTNRLFVSL